MWVLSLFACSQDMPDAYEPTCVPPACSQDTPYVYEPTCDRPIPTHIGPAPTWSADIQPLIAARCAACHVEGGLGPEPFETYAQTAPWAQAIAAMTAARAMPPFSPTNCGECNTFADAGTLTDAEIAMLEAWADAGAPEGDPDAVPTPPEQLPELPRADRELRIAPFRPFSEATDVYRCFLLDPELDADRYMTGFEVIPGAPQMVHHAVVGAIDNDKNEAIARARDQAEPGPGWSCYGGFEIGGVRTVAGYVPGSGAKKLPDGTGIRLTARRPVVLQIHYNTAAGVSVDETALRLMLEDDAARPMTVERYADTRFELPPGEPEVSVLFERPLDRDGAFYGLAPHEHELGTRIKAEVVRADGTVDCLVDVPRWDFHWQGFFFYEEPVPVRRGDTVRVYCEWRTEGVDQPVGYGEGTADEMCLVLTYFAPEE